jgi:uncharacterized membrane protein
VLVLLGLVYPYAGSYARTGGFANAPTLDGLGWLRRIAPGDPAAIAWLRDHTPPSAVVLEAFGDDYSAFGAARISTFSGRATVIGWAGHELQWHHPPGTRANDVKTLYTTPDAATARPLLARYGIRYVVVGPLEHTTYGDAGDAKWAQLGRRVFARAGTTIWARCDSLPGGDETEKPWRRHDSGSRVASSSWSPTRCPGGCAMSCRSRLRATGWSSVAGGTRPSR